MVKQTHASYSCYAITMRDLLVISLYIVMWLRSCVVFDPDTVLWMGVFSEGGGHPLALGELQELEVGGRRYGFWVPLHADYFGSG